VCLRHVQHGASTLMRFFNGARAGQGAASARLIQNNVAIRQKRDDDKPQNDDSSPVLNQDSDRDASNDSSLGSDMTDDDAEAQRAVHEADCLNALVAPPRHDKRSRTRGSLNPSPTDRKVAGSSRGPRTSFTGEQASAWKTLSRKRVLLQLTQSCIFVNSLMCCQQHWTSANRLTTVQTLPCLPASKRASTLNGWTSHLLATHSPHLSARQQRRPVPSSKEVLRMPRPPTVSEIRCLLKAGNDYQTASAEILRRKIGRVRRWKVDPLPHVISPTRTRTQVAKRERAGEKEEGQLVETSVGRVL